MTKFPESRLTLQEATFREGCKFLLGRERMRILTVSNLTSLSMIFATYAIEAMDGQMKLLDALEKDDFDTIDQIKKSLRKDMSASDKSVDGVVHFLTSMLELSRNWEAKE